MKLKNLVYIPIIAIAACSVYLFPRVAEVPVTFTDLQMDKEATIEKYADVWDDHTINTMPTPNFDYELGDIVATITIPDLGIYELPVYYGSNFVNNNWQITMPGHLGNWGIVGEATPTCMGAHNYQLFNKLPTLAIGTKFIVETKWDVYVYVITDTDIYDHLKDDWGDLVYNNKDDYMVELMTCYPISMVETNDMYIASAKMQKGTKFVDE